MKEFYIKEGRKYRPAGHEFKGFPANGFWVVLDGTSNCIYHIDKSVTSEVPQLYHSRHIIAIMDKINKASSMSVWEAVRLTCEYFDNLPKERNNNGSKDSN